MTLSILQSRLQNEQPNAIFPEDQEIGALNWPMVFRLLFSLNLASSDL